MVGHDLKRRQARRRAPRRCRRRVICSAGEFHARLVDARRRRTPRPPMPTDARDADARYVEARPGRRRTHRRSRCALRSPRGSRRRPCRAHTGKRTRVRHGVGGQVRHHRAGEEVGGPAPARPSAGHELDLAAERRQNQRDFGGRIGVGDRAADRAARASRAVTDPRQGGGEQRQLRADQRVALDLELAGRGADGDRVALVGRCRRAPARRAMSMRREGRARRIAIIGTSVWPPAMSRASSSARSMAQACATFRPHVLEGAQPSCAALPQACGLRRNRSGDCF